MSTAATTTSTRHVVIDSPIGPLTLVRDDDGLTGLYYPGHWTRPDQTTFGSRVEPSEDHGFDEAICRLIPLAANGPGKSGSCSPKSRTARPPLTARWQTKSVAA
jgi:hypothetical protein